jgi:hypothetical protein
VDRNSDAPEYLLTPTRRTVTKTAIQTKTKNGSQFGCLTSCLFY